MSRPAIFSEMAEAFVSSLGNVEVLIMLGSAPDASTIRLCGILRTIRETDLLDIEGMGLEGISYSFAASGSQLDGVRQKHSITILSSDDGLLVGKVFIIAGVVDDGRAMKRLLLHEDD